MKVLKTMHTFYTDHIYVEAYSRYYGWTPDGERAEIWRNLDTLVTQLDDLGIKYETLRNALCPRQDKREACLMFNSFVLSEKYGNYAYGASKFIVPALPGKLNTAIHHGDLITWGYQGVLDYLACAYPYLDLDGVTSSSQVYCVHLSNLSPGTLSAIDAQLKRAPGYIGVVDTTLQSPLKNMLSGTITAELVKVGSTYISSHYEELEAKTGEYEGNWELGDARLVSVYDLLFGQYLAYKIQQSSDGVFSRNEALMLTSLDAGYGGASTPEVAVSITDDKFNYLTQAKGVNLKNMGLDGITADALCALVLERIRGHYIYGLRLLDNGDLLCSTLIEVERAGRTSYRAEIGLRLEPDESRFCITTFY
ncbi:hypothetical protein [Gordonia sp. N1V]|uniref:hypothetical protein n=1 Tax=Gordonia sp. N1V TaxID=3034163 RepID=UPI0023E24A4B|nr:hypothetical protein [Gordonia sp. N1V]MDF3285326.1 hypothetical protein [Gordonia sp. N1V]